MAKTYNASEQVPLGREGTGAAQILQGELKPLEFYVRSQEFQQEMALKAAQYAERQRNIRDTNFRKMWEWNPDKTWEPFQKQIHSFVENNVSGWLRNKYNAGTPWWDSDLNAELKARQNKANEMAGIANHYKTVFQEAKKKYTDNDYFDQEHYDSKLLDIFFNTDGSARNVDEIDATQVNNLLNDASGYQVRNIAKDFVSDLPERVIERYEQRANQLGVHFDKTKLKGKLFSLDRDGKLYEDEDGNIIVEITPEVVTLARQDRLMNNLIQHYKAQDPSRSERDILTEILTPHAYAERTHAPSGITKYPAEGGGGSKEDLIFKRDIAKDQKTNFVASVEGGKKQPHESMIFDSYRLGGKKMDKPLYTHSTKVFDMESGEYVSSIGDTKLIPTRLQYLAIGPDDKPYPVKSKEDFIPGRFKTGWFLQGVIKGGEDRLGQYDARIEKKVLIPYGDVRDDLLEQYGVNLADPEREISDEELIQLIYDNYPDLSPQEKLQKFKELKQ